jgi:hypothetical protein
LSFWLDQQGGPVVVNTSKCAWGKLSLVNSQIVPKTASNLIKKAPPQSTTKQNQQISNWEKARTRRTMIRPIDWLVSETAEDVIHHNFAGLGGWSVSSPSSRSSDYVIGTIWYFQNGQDVLPCALTLTAYIQFPLMFLFGLFCRPFGGQKPSSVVDHGIRFFQKPDPFSRIVIRNCMIFLFQSILINHAVWAVPVSSKRKQNLIQYYSWYFQIDFLCDIRL